MLMFTALYLHRLPLFGPRLLRRMVESYDLNVSQEVVAISGAAMLGRRDVLQELNGFDETFLYTGEDIDLCLRLRERGSKIFYLSDAVIVHFGGQSSSQAWARSGTLGVLSTERYLIRFHGRPQATAYRLVVKLVQMPMMVLIGVAKTFLGRGDREELRQRLRFANAIWRWREEG